LQRLKVHNRLQAFFKKPITKIIALSGGDISQAYLIEISQDQNFFLKLNDSAIALDMFEKEASGLKHIQSSKTIAVPEVFGVYADEQGAALVLEYIKPSNAYGGASKRFGKELAAMHDTHQATFGLETDNYIGRLIQHNQSAGDWASFYAEQRLHQQFQLALKNGFFSENDLPTLQHTTTTLKQILAVIKPCLLHGDLWSGNFIINESGRPYLIDPAVYFGDPYVDIAMSRLFGDFGKDFYESYYHWSPKADNIQERIDLYQLYFLLVHLNMFGKSFYNPVKAIMDRYF
jgi:fructosamine-3-kinase